MGDSIEYEIVSWEPREVWRCSVCKSYRHRPTRTGQLQAVCCGQPAKLIDRYQQPRSSLSPQPSSSPSSEST